MDPTTQRRECGDVIA